MGTRQLIIDCHSHALDFDTVARGGFAKLRSIGDAMASCGYDKLNLMSITPYQPEFIAQNPLCLLAKTMYPGKIYAFGSLFYPPEGLPVGELEFKEQAKRLVAAGFDGIKMIEGKPNTRKRLGIPLDSFIYDEFFSWMQERQLPLIYHVGDPSSFWDRENVPAWARESGWFYGDGTYLERDVLFGESAGILKKFPRLRISFAHFYFMSNSPEEASAFLDKWPSVCFDITPGSEMYFDFSANPKVWREFFIRYQDRILFGTDNDVDDQHTWAENVAIIRRFLETNDRFKGFMGQPMIGLCLPIEVLRKIYFKNFLSFVSGTPKNPETHLAIEECRWLMGIVPNAPYRQQVLSQLGAVLEEFSQISQKVKD